jgi:hypothetical protein
VATRPAGLNGAVLPEDVARLDELSTAMGIGMACVDMERGLKRVLQ